MEIVLYVIVGVMIVGALYALNAKDLLSAIISCGIVGYGLVICFLLLKAPDLAIVQIVVETITLIIMVAVVVASSRKEIDDNIGISVKGVSYLNTRYVVDIILVVLFALLLFDFFRQAIDVLEPFGVHTSRMSVAYTENGGSVTGSANLVTGVLFDFRAYDTLGEATVLFTAAIGVLTVLRLKGKKQARGQ
jgi:multisubunit Na+/H+ antiporter MnhB subunit